MITVDKFTPWANKYLVRPLPKKEKSDGGIIIADTVALEAEEAVIIAKGENATKGEVGETVLYGAGAGWSLTVNGEKMRVIPQEAIEGTVS